jgi:hypothetical protein
MSTIELRHDKIEEAIKSICDHVALKGFDRLHTAVALRCILRAIEKNEGIEVQIEEPKQDLKRGAMQ